MKIRGSKGEQNGGGEGTEGECVLSYPTKNKQNIKGGFKYQVPTDTRRNKRAQIRRRDGSENILFRAH